MFRKATTFLFLFVLMVCLVLPAGAQTIPLVVDEADLLLAEEITALENLSAELADQYDVHAVILVTDSLNGKSAQDYADDYYDNGGYLEDGVIFLLSMAEREWYISTCGSMIYALTDYGIQQIGEGSVSYFSDGLWYDGFHYFLTTLPTYLDALEAGTPIDGFADYSGDYYHGDQEEVIYYEEEFTPWFALSLFCGIVVATITVLVMRLGMNSKRAQRCATAYLSDGSWNLTQNRDLFLYSKVTKTRKQENTTTRTGGGSSVHRSSGGRSHGGGGGRF